MKEDDCMAIDPINEIVNEEMSLTEKIKSAFGQGKTSRSALMTAQTAWLQSMYGTGYMATAKERIASKQAQIESIIKSKFRFTICNDKARNNEASSSQYHCVVDIEEDLVKFIDQVFEPFKNSGFDIISLSEHIDILKDEHVYLLSWKKAFDVSR